MSYSVMAFVVLQLLQQNTKKKQKQNKNVNK